MSNKIANQLLARIQNEMGHNITVIKNQLTEWLERPESGGVDLFCEQLNEVSGGLSLLARDSAVTLSNNIISATKKLDEKLKKNQISQTQFNAIGAEVASGLILLSDYIDHLGESVYNDAEIEQIANVIHELTQGSSSAIAVQPKIDKETYQALAARVGEIIDINRNEIEHYVIQNNKDFNVNVLIKRNEDLANIFELLELTAPQILLKEINQTLRKQPTATQWIDIAEGMILIEQTLQSVPQKSKKDKVDNLSDAIRLQSVYARELEVRKVVKNTGKLAHQFFESFRKILTQDNQLLPEQPWFEAAKRSIHYSSVMQLVGETELSKTLNRLGRIFAEVSLHRSINEKVFSLIIDALVGVEYVSSDLADTARTNINDVKFLNSAILSVAKIYQPSAQASELLKEFITTEPANHSDKVEEATAQDFDALLDSLGALEDDYDGREIGAEQEELDDEDIQQPLSVVIKEGNEDNTTHYGTFLGSKTLDELQALSIPPTKQGFTGAHESAVMDDEIRGFFLEELDEKIEEIQNEISNWVTHPQNQEVIATIRRAFHTIKGSGRTVGYEALGECAWQHEQMLNKVLDKTFLVHPVVQEMVADTVAMLKLLRSGDDFREEKGALLTQASIAEQLTAKLIESPDENDANLQEFLETVRKNVLALRGDTPSSATNMPAQAAGPASSFADSAVSLTGGSAGVVADGVTASSNQSSVSATTTVAQIADNTPAVEKSSAAFVAQPITEISSNNDIADAKQNAPKQTGQGLAKTSGIDFDIETPSVEDATHSADASVNVAADEQSQVVTSIDFDIETPSVEGAAQSSGTSVNVAADEQSQVATSIDFDIETPSVEDAAQSSGTSVNVVADEQSQVATSIDFDFETPSVEDATHSAGTSVNVAADEQSQVATSIDFDFETPSVEDVTHSADTSVNVAADENKANLPTESVAAIAVENASTDVPLTYPSSVMTSLTPDTQEDSVQHEKIAALADTLSHSLKASMDESISNEAFNQISSELESNLAKYAPTLSPADLSSLSQQISANLASELSPEEVHEILQDMMDKYQTELPSLVVSQTQDFVDTLPPSSVEVSAPSHHQQATDIPSGYQHMASLLEKGLQMQPLDEEEEKILASRLVNELQAMSDNPQDVFSQAQLRSHLEPFLQGQTVNSDSYQNIIDGVVAQLRAGTAASTMGQSSSHTDAQHQTYRHIAQLLAHALEEQSLDPEEEELLLQTVESKISSMDGADTLSTNDIRASLEAFSTDPNYHDLMNKALTRLQSKEGAIDTASHVEVQHAVADSSSEALSTVAEFHDDLAAVTSVVDSAHDLAAAQGLTEGDLTAQTGSSVSVQAIDEVATTDDAHGLAAAQGLTEGDLTAQTGSSVSVQAIDEVATTDDAHGLAAAQGLTEGDLTAQVGSSVSVQAIDEVATTDDAHGLAAAQGLTEGDLTAQVGSSVSVQATDEVATTDDAYGLAAAQGLIEGELPAQTGSSASVQAIDEVATTDDAHGLATASGLIEEDLSADSGHSLSAVQGLAESDLTAQAVAAMASHLADSTPVAADVSAESTDLSEVNVNGDAVLQQNLSASKPSLSGIKAAKNNAKTRLNEELANISQHPSLQDAVSANHKDTTHEMVNFLSAVDQFDTLSKQLEKENNVEVIDDLIDSVYDIEDALDPSTVPDWVWRMLDAMEQLLLVYKSEGVDVGHSAASILRQSVDIIEHHDTQDGEEEITQVINSLLNARQQISPQTKAVQVEQPMPRIDNEHGWDQWINDPNAGTELVETFLDEAISLLGHSQREADSWDSNREQMTHLDAIRRDMHTLKGSARMAGYLAIGDLTHAVESMIESIIDGKSEANNQAVAILSGAIWQGMIMLDSVRDGYLPQTDPYMLNNINRFLGLPLPYPEVAEAERRIKEEEKISAATPTIKQPQTVSPVDLEEKPSQVDENVNRFDENIDPVLVDIFSDEAQELIAQAGVLLADNLKNPEVIEDLKRNMHTLKGGARLVGLTPIGDTSHLMESVIEHVPEYNDTKIRQAKQLLNIGHDTLYSMLDSVLRQEMPTPAHSLNQSLEIFSKEGRYVAPALDTKADEIKQTPESQPSQSQTEAPVKPEMATPAGDDKSATSQHQAPQELSADEQGSSVAADFQTASVPEVPSVNVNDAADLVTPSLPQKVKDTKPDTIPNEIQRYVRVDANLLDEMIAMIGETAILRSRMENLSSSSEFNLNELTRIATRIDEQMRRLDNETEAQMLFRRESQQQDDEHFDPLEMDRFSEIQQLSRQLAEAIDDLKNVQDTLSNENFLMRNLSIQQSIIQRGIQDRLLTTQLVRFDTNEPRLKRLVRQTASVVGKEVNFILEGGEVELERRLIEDVLPAIEHMIRNSISHGIESARERIAAGKPAHGTIKLSIEAKASNVELRVLDDGRGFDYDKIREKARAKGWLDPEKADDTQYLTSLMMRSGLSTASAVTQIAGRGVGMDVVNEMVKQRRGQMVADSIPGKGAQFTIMMPFSMSISEVLLVDIAEQIYAVPMNSIAAVHQIERSVLEKSYQQEEVYYHYNGMDYRVYILGNYFKLSEYELALEADMAPVLFIHAGGEPVAFYVDKIANRLEIIVKNVNRQVLNIPGISGATILGDGQVVPVLELLDLSRRIAGLRHFEVESEVEEVTTKNILVVDDSVTMRKVSTRLLERNGYTVEVAKDGLDAIDVIQNFVPDLILLDIEMPRMDGFEFATHIRQNSNISHVPIVMVTSRTGEKHRERAENIGVQGYLGKPYREDILVDTLKHIIGESNNG